MTAWEYRVEPCSDEWFDGEDRLDEFGEAGWELVQILIRSASPSTYPLTAVFKRPVQSGSTP